MVSVESTEPTRAPETRVHLDRVLHSETFRKAPALRHLLEYLVVESAEGRAEQIKESVIAVEVFGRKPNFDGRLDNIVRVQAHRLRKLLDAYYADEGKSDKLRFGIPRGSYVPQFAAAEEQAVIPEPLPEAPAVAILETLPAVPPLLRRRALWPFAATFTAGALLTLLITFLMAHRNAAQNNTPTGPVADVWKAVFEPGVKLIVSYTNPVFLRVGKSKMYILYSGPLSAPPGTQIHVDESDAALDRKFLPKDEPLFFNDGWTGIGEVLAVNRLTELAAQYSERLNVIPSRTLALNEMRDANVVFLGSPWVNGALAQMGNDTTPFYNTNDGRIVVRNPAAGERAEYRNDRDESTSQIKSCYALLSVLPGIGDGRKVISSAGIGTWATWAGIDFVTTPQGAAQLTQALKAANGGRMPQYYQAIVRADIVKGAASNQLLIATRKLR
jgi:hypothetical protein